MSNVEEIIRLYNKAQNHLEDESLRKEDGEYLSRFYEGLKSSFEYLIEQFGGNVTYDRNHRMTELRLPNIKEADSSAINSIIDMAEENGKFYCSKECHSLNRRMKISELIRSLEEAKKEHGNIEVRVQYRDDTMDYEGKDMLIKDYYDEEENIYVL